MKYSNSRTRWGFTVAGAALGLILPALFQLFSGMVPDEFYYSDHYLLQNLSFILTYAGAVSSYAYVAVFICSAVYERIGTTLLVFASRAVYDVGCAVYNIISVPEDSFSDGFSMPIFWLSIIGSIILVPAVWYGITKLISLIKMPATAKVLISAVPAFLVYNFSSIISMIRYPDTASQALTALLVPFVIYFVTVMFMSIIINDIITRPAKSTQTAGETEKSGAEE